MFLLLMTACRQENVVLEEIKQLNYPSASGMDIYNKQVYIIGDDATRLLVTDSNLAPVDSLLLYDFPGRRIPKNIKPDLEAMTFTNRREQPVLLVIGSGSLTPFRHMAWWIDPVTKKTDSIRLDTFYRRLGANGLDEINIEGLCEIPGQMLLSNRGSKGYPKNHLVLTSRSFWKNQADAPLTLIRMGVQTDSSVFNGISGLAYARKSDRLLLTVSTEDTRNSFDDGAIGDSYLWIVDNISAKKNWKAINPNREINLTETDTRFKGKKIESVCVVKETNRFLHLLLAADNDDGKSTLYRLAVEKN